MVASPPEDAAALRTELVEVLKQLNRGEMEEEGGVEGLEIDELHHFLARGPLPSVSAESVGTALKVLVGNGYARELDDPEYAWNRGRIVGARYLITTEGKEFLLREIQRVGRI